MLDNFEIIKPLLVFGDPNDFFHLQILKRKKDLPDSIKNEHQSVRTIKTYHIGSLEYLEKKYSEITDLCEFFGARAYINLSPKNHKKVTMMMLKLLASKIGDEQYNQNGLFDSAIGDSKSKNKRFLLDVDTKDKTNLENLKNELNRINQFRGDKLILAEIPTNSGYHIITNPFNFNLISSKFPGIELKKDNPTLLYFPESLTKI